MKKRKRLISLITQKKLLLTPPFPGFWLNLFCKSELAMRESNSKEKILKKVREALSNPVPLPFPKSEGTSAVFVPPDQELEIIFAEEFTKLLGKFAFCVNAADMKLQLQGLIAQQKWTNICCQEDRLRALLQDETFPPLHRSKIGRA